jgi:secreted trypsin-like serine protease
VKIFKNFTLFFGIFMSACSPLKYSEYAEINSSEKENQPSNIISGVEVDNNSTLSKSVVLLVNILTQEICSAALIGSQYALTATHCLDKEDPNNLFIFFAAKPDFQTERRQVVAMRTPPSGNIALLKFEGETLPKGFEEASFLPVSEKIQKGARVIVLGYGIKEAQSKAGAGILRYTTLTVSDPNYSSTEILLDQSKGSSVCHGDSGGPAYFLRKDSYGQPKLYLWGIADHASLNDVNDQCNKGVIYINALVFLPWIENVLRTL